MDDYKKLGALEWGRKARKTISRASKALFRALTGREMKEELAGPTIAEIKFEEEQARLDLENAQIMAHADWDPERNDPYDAFLYDYTNDCGCRECQPCARCWPASEPCNRCNCTLCTGEPKLECDRCLSYPCLCEDLDPI